MARLGKTLPLFAFLVFFISSVESTDRQECHRVFPFHLTAVAMPCRYICAHNNGYAPQYRVRGEDDGKFCRKHGKDGVCWSGECLTRYGLDDEWSQQADATSKVPLRIRKRDVTSATKGVTVSKTAESNGDSSFTTKTVHVKAVKATTGSEESASAVKAGFQGTYMNGFSKDDASKDTKNGMQSEPNPDINPFAIKTAPPGGQTTETFFSRGTLSPGISNTVKNGDVKITVHRGPNGEKVTTRTVRKYVITQGPTKTVKRIIIRHGSTGARASMTHGDNKTFATKTLKVSVRRGSTGGTSGLMAGRSSGLSTKTSQITTLQANAGARQNPFSSVVHTIKQKRISGGHIVGGKQTATKIVSSVAVTNKVSPLLSVGTVTKQGATPFTAASLGTSNTGTLRGVEVEVPGYTAGLRNNWKWVLARRVGVYPPYVQALDPDVLFYKLGLPKPNFPTLPGPIQNILHRIPVHPVGSDLYGYLLSSRILEKIRGFTDGVNGLTRLTSMLSTTNTSSADTSNILKNLVSGSHSSPSSSTFLQKLLLASLSGPRGNPLKSPYSGYLNDPYGSLFGGPNAVPYGSPWPTFSGGQFTASSWPFYNGLVQLGRFGLNPSLFPNSPFGSYGSLGTTKSSNGVQDTLSEEESLGPSTGTPLSGKAESLLGGSSYISSLLAPLRSGRRTTERRYGQSYDEPLEHVSEDLARALGEEKLRQLVKLSNERDSPVHHILKSLYLRDYYNAPIFLRRLGVRPNTRLYNRIMRQILLRSKHADVFSPSKEKMPYGGSFERALSEISALRDLNGNRNYDKIRRLLKLGRGEPRLLESSIDGFEGSNNKLNALIQLLLERKHHLHPARPRDSIDDSDMKEVVDALLNYPSRHPSSDRAAQISKQVTKALLTSGQDPMSTDRSREARLSKLVSVHGTSHTQKIPQGLTESQVISTTYHTSKGAATVPHPIAPATASGLQVTRSITQPSLPAALLGVNSISTTASGPSSVQTYPQLVAQPFYPSGGNSVSDQQALLNRQFVSSTGSVYSSPIGLPTPTVMTGTGEYSGYAAMPANTAYISQYASQPYYLGTSPYGSHPHYVVEGHEAPGTRWQLRVWRHHPGVASAAPGFSGFGSNHLGSVVTRARETVTRGLQLGNHPGQFGFTTYGSSIPGPQVIGGTSQYVVRAPDGSIVLSRQPLNYGTATPVAPTSSVVVSQRTQQMTKTPSGASLPSVSAGVSSNSLQTAEDHASSTGGGKSQSLSELTQSKQSNLFSDMASDDGSEKQGSLFPSDGSSSSSLQEDVDFSQSKLSR